MTITNDHNCGYIYEIFQEDGEDWYFKQGKYAKKIIINFCPMCGRDLHKEYWEL